MVKMTQIEAAISSQNKLINALNQRNAALNGNKMDSTDLSINLSSIQHAIDNTENIHNYTHGLHEADLSYKNLLGGKVDSSAASSNNDIKVQVCEIYSRDVNFTIK